MHQQINEIAETGLSAALYLSTGRTVHGFPEKIDNPHQGTVKIFDGGVACEEVDYMSIRLPAILAVGYSGNHVLCSAHDCPFHHSTGTTLSRADCTCKIKPDKFGL